MVDNEEKRLIGDKEKPTVLEAQAAVVRPLLTIQTISSRATTTVAAAAATVATMTWIENEEEEKERAKKFVFSKPKEVVLASEKIKRNMVTFGCWEKEKEKEEFLLVVQFFLVEVE